MRHVPDDELHAYLDQALSRSQCVEIETHMAACARCSDRRDFNASMRDRTTAMLAQLTPRALIVPPPYQSLVDRKIQLAPFARWQKSLRRSALWAAGVAAAVGAGWAGRSIFDPPARLQFAAQEPSLLFPAVPLNRAPLEDFQPTAAPIPIPNPERPAPSVAIRPITRRVANQSIDPAPVLQFVSAALPMREALNAEPAPVSRPAAPASAFDRIWRSVPWEEALQIAGSSLPFIEGLPVLGVLVQPGAAGERPTVIVAQQDGSGEVIQSIEGPVDKVTEMLKRQSAPEIQASAPTRTPPDYVDEHGKVRRAIRVLTVTGRLSVDSLNQLARMATIR